MIKITKQNQKIVMGTRNDVLSAKLAAGEITQAKFDAIFDTCVGINHNEHDKECGACPDLALCKQIQTDIENKIAAGTEPEQPAAPKKAAEKAATATETEQPKKKTEKAIPAAKKSEPEQPAAPKKAAEKAAEKPITAKKTTTDTAATKTEEKAPTKVHTIDAIILKYDYSGIEDKEVADTIKNLTRDAKRSQKNAILSMVELGKYLLDARVMFKRDGQFFDWLISEFEMVPNQFYSTVNIYKRFGSKVTQLSDKVAFSTLATLASDSFTEDEVTDVVKAISSGKITGTLTSIQDYVRKMRIAEETKSTVNAKERDEDDDADDNDAPEAKTSKKSATPNPGLDISDDDAVDFGDFAKELEAFVKLIQATSTVNEKQFAQLQIIKDNVKVLNEELDLKLTEVDKKGGKKNGKTA